jgi:hypothetical protein
MCHLDVVEHKIEGRSRPGLGWSLGLPDNQMSAAAQLKYCKIAA